MTDIESLARREWRRIRWQETTETYTQDDLQEDIEEAIRELYVHIGRGDEDIDSLFTYNDADVPESFEDDLDERMKLWVV